MVKVVQKICIFLRFMKSADFSVSGSLVACLGRVSGSGAALPRNIKIVYDL